MENIIIKFTADTDGLRPAIEQLQLLGKISEEDAKKIDSINQSQKQYLQTLNATTTEAGKFNEEIKDLEKIIKAEVLAGMADAMIDYANEAEQATGQTVSLKKELKLLKEQIASGQFKGEELRQMTRRAAELQDRIGDVNQRVRALASDTKRLDAVVGAFRGLAAAGSVAAGAMGLLGQNNEELQKTLVKVQSAMAVLNGVQEISKMLTAESALKTMVLDGAQKAVAVSARVMGVSVAEATAAMTMGLSLVVAGLVYLISSMDDAAESSKNMTEQLMNDAKLMQKLTDIRIGMIKDGRARELMAEKIAFQRQLRELNKQLRKREISHQLHAEAVEVITDQHHKNMADINTKYDEEEKKRREKAAAEADAAREKRREKDYNELQAKIRDEIAGYELLINATSNIDEKMKYHQKITELRQEQVRLNKTLGDNEKKLEIDRLRDLQRIYEESFNKRDDADLNSFIDMQDEKMDESLDWWIRYMEVEEKYYAELAKKRKEQIQMWTQFAIDNAQVVANALFQIAANRLKAETDMQLEALDIEREQTLRNKNLTEEQRARIEERYRNQERAIKRNAWERQRQADIASAIIATALAIAKALPNVPLSVAAGIAGAAQVGVIASQPTPRFAEGTEYFIGKGTGTSDHNLAWLSSGERVVSAKTNADYYGALSAIHNREVEPGLANNIMEALKVMDLTLAPQFSKPEPKDKQLDPMELAQILERNRTQVSISLDEQGFTKHIRKSTTTTNYRNAKFRFQS